MRRGQSDLENSRTKIVEEQRSFDGGNHYENRKPRSGAKGWPRDTVRLAQGRHARDAIGDAFFVGIDDAARIPFLRQLFLRIQQRVGAFPELVGEGGIAVARLTQPHKLFGRRRLYSTMDHESDVFRELLTFRIDSAARDCSRHFPGLAAG